MAIDLTKLKALALPSKEITVDLLGEPQTLTITAFGDEVSLNMADIWDNFKSDGTVRVRTMLLQNCAGLSAEDASLLLARDGAAASKILNEIFALTDEFEQKRREVREAAKKKSNPGERPAGSN